MFPFKIGQLVQVMNLRLNQVRCNAEILAIDRNSGSCAVINRDRKSVDIFVVEFNEIQSVENSHAQCK